MVFVPGVYGELQVVRRARATVVLVLVLAVFGGLGGCATQGPNHLYLAGADRLRDYGSGRQATPLAVDARLDLSPFVPAGRPLLGLAYDPFTDHLFLRLGDGAWLRVVDRPGRRIKYQFRVADLPPGLGDMAIRLPDRHLFLTHPSQPALLEVGPWEKKSRLLPLAGLTAPVVGVAIDPPRKCFYVLVAGETDRLAVFSYTGASLGGHALARPLRPHALAYDAAAGELYGFLADVAETEPVIGVFDREGRLVRTQPLPAETVATPWLFIEAGPRSPVRLF